MIKNSLNAIHDTSCGLPRNGMIENGRKIVKGSKAMAKTSKRNVGAGLFPVIMVRPGLPEIGAEAKTINSAIANGPLKLIPKKNKQ